MFIPLLIINIFLCIIVQCAPINTLKEKPTPSLTFPKQYSNDYDGNLNIEGSGSHANLDEYPDEDDDDDDGYLSKLTSTTTSTRVTTTKRVIPKFAVQKKIIESIDDVDSNEFDDDYKEDLEEDTIYNEVATKVTTTSPSSTNSLNVTRRPASIRGFLSFLSRPPIAAGILGGSYF